VAVTVTVPVPVATIERLGVDTPRFTPGACNICPVQSCDTVRPSPLAVTVKVKEPIGAAVVAERVRVEEPALEERLTVLPLQEAVTPLGRPETASETGP
jgi:hypothetical protein